MPSRKQRAILKYPSHRYTRSMYFTGNYFIQDAPPKKNNFRYGAAYE
jgi:hypothetical protein